MLDFPNLIQIKKKTIDMYTPGKLIPSFQLKLEKLDRREKGSGRLQIKLIGAKEPNNTFLIDAPNQGEV